MEAGAPSRIESGKRAGANQARSEAAKGNQNAAKNKNSPATTGGDTERDHKAEKKLLSSTAKAAAASAGRKAVETFNKLTGFTEMANTTTLNRAGRKLGAKNRVSSELKEMVEQALEQAGGVGYLAEQARENPSAFLALVGKLLPKNVNAEVSGPDNAPMNMTIRFVTPGETTGGD